MDAVANIAKVYFGNPDDYDVVKNTDIMHHDLLDTGTHTWTQDVDQLMFVCDVDPLCIGFNTNGFLKVADEGRYTISGVDLYLKKSAQ